MARGRSQLAIITDESKKSDYFIKKVRLLKDILHRLQARVGADFMLVVAGEDTGNNEDKDIDFSIYNSSSMQSFAERLDWEETIALQRQQWGKLYRNQPLPETANLFLTLDKGCQVKLITRLLNTAITNRARRFPWEQDPMVAKAQQALRWRDDTCQQAAAAPGNSEAATAVVRDTAGVQQEMQARSSAAELAAAATDPAAQGQAASACGVHIAGEASDTDAGDVFAQLTPRGAQKILGEEVAEQYEWWHPQWNWQRPKSMTAQRRQEVFFAVAGALSSDDTVLFRAETAIEVSHNVRTLRRLDVLLEKIENGVRPVTRGEYWADYPSRTQLCRLAAIIVLHCLVISPCLQYSPHDCRTDDWLWPAEDSEHLRRAGEESTVGAGTAGRPHLSDECTEQDVLACLAHSGGVAEVHAWRAASKMPGTDSKVNLHQLHNVLQRFGGVEQVGAPPSSCCLSLQAVPCYTSLMASGFDFHVLRSSHASSKIVC